MNATFILIILVIVVLFVLAIFAYLIKIRHSFRPEELRKAVEQIFEVAEEEEIHSKLFILALKGKFNCSHKEALYLFGQARHCGIIKVTDRIVTLIPA